MDRPLPGLGVLACARSGKSCAGLERGRVSPWVGRAFRFCSKRWSSEDDDEDSLWFSSLKFAVALKAAARDLPVAKPGRAFARAFWRFGGLLAGLGVGM